MIRDEDGLLTGYVYVGLATTDYGGYVARAQRTLDAKLRLPPGYSIGRANMNSSCAPASG
jgi:Cu(I)/Ag(I) efflux system membrane protein CusA/SilA